MIRAPGFCYAMMAALAIFAVGESVCLASLNQRLNTAAVRSHLATASHTKCTASRSTLCVTL